MGLGLGWVGGPPLPALTSPHPAGGETEEEILRVDMLENQIMDFRMSLVMVCYNPDFVSVPVLQAWATVPMPGSSLAVPWVASASGTPRGEGVVPWGWGDQGAQLHPSTPSSCRRSSSRATWSSSRGS